MNKRTDQFGRPLDTSSKNEPKEHTTNTVNHALENIKEEMNSPSNQTFEPPLDTQDQANDFENKDSFEASNTEEKSPTQDFSNDFTPSESKDTFTEEFNVDSTPNKEAESTNDQSTPYSPSAQPLDNSFTDTQDNQPTSQPKLTPDAAAVHEYQVQLIKMMQLIQSQNLQILGLSKKLDDLSEQRLLENKKDNIEEIENKIKESEKEKKQEKIDQTVIVTPPPQPSLDQSSSIKQTASPQEVKEKTKLQLTLLGGIIFIIFFLFIILGMYSYLVLEKILPLSSNIPGYILILSIIDLYKELFFWL